MTQSIPTGVGSDHVLSRFVAMGGVDYGQMHTMIYSMFPPGSTHDDRRGADSAAILWRVDQLRDGLLSVLIQSRIKPLAIAGVPLESRPLGIPQSGQHRFRLSFAPLARSKGVARVLTKWTDQCEWLQNKASRSGFSIEFVDPVDHEMIRVPHHHGGTISICRVTVDGILSVVDPAAFALAVTAGIGRHRAWGCGLISLA